MQLKDAAQLALKKMPSAEQEALSQVSYFIITWILRIIKLGFSHWCTAVTKKMLVSEIRRMPYVCRTEMFQGLPFLLEYFLIIF